MQCNLQAFLSWYLPRLHVCVCVCLCVHVCVCIHPPTPFLFVLFCVLYILCHFSRAQHILIKVPSGGKNTISQRFYLVSLKLQGACTGQLQCYGHCTWELGQLFPGHCACEVSWSVCVCAWEVSWSSMGLCMRGELEFYGSVH